MFSETDACVPSTEKNTSETAHEQIPTYETIPTIGDNTNSHNYNELSDTISTVAHPQLLVIAKSDKSIQKQEKSHLQLDIISSTNLSSTIHLEQNIRSSDLQVDKRGHYDQICQYESISHYEKVPHCDLALISSAQRKRVHDEKLPPPTCYLTETRKK